jgi:photosystem II stability/assembly factor-like uncharacterized protein
MRTRCICLALDIVLLSTFASAQWVQKNSGQTRDLYGVRFTDPYTGTVVGDSGTILRTTNGGTTWRSQSSRTTGWLRRVCFSDASTGTAVGDSGTVLHTTNGGETLTRQESETAIPLRSISFSDANTGTVVGGQQRDDPPFSTDGVILRTTNGGASWTSQSSPTTTNLNGVCFTGANSGTAVGIGGSIIHTTNGGVTFVEAEQPQEVSLQYLLNQNYPNPFNPKTVVSCQLPAASSVKLVVYDVLGQEVAVLVNERRAAGNYR